MVRHCYENLRKTSPALPATLRIALLAGLLAALTGCQTRTSHRYRRVIMGVDAVVTVWAPSETAARRAATAAFDRMHELDACLSDYRADSELMTLVRAAAHDDAQRPASADLRAVITRARAVHDASDGAFDITIAPVVHLWRDARRRGVRPDPVALDAARSRVGMDRVTVRGDDVRLARGTMLDPGGIGKGYALDAALDAVRDAGCPRAVIDLGGDLAIGAPPPGASDWPITIRTGAGREVTQRLVRCGVATSGDLEQFVEIDGVRYSHLVDPRTGLGMTHRRAVTVIAPNATDADALASALSVAPLERAAAILACVPGARARIEWPRADGTIVVRRVPEDAVR